MPVWSQSRHKIGMPEIKGTPCKQVFPAPLHRYSRPGFVTSGFSRARFTHRSIVRVVTPITKASLATSQPFSTAARHIWSLWGCNG